MSTPLQNTGSSKYTDKVLPGFYFPTDGDGRVLPLFSGDMPSRPRSTLSAREMRPAGMDLPVLKVITERTVVSADADLRVSRLSSPSPSIRQHRLVRAQSAPGPCLALTPAAQQPEPPHQAPLFPCDSAGAVLPLFHPSTATSSSPRSRSTTATMSLDNSPTSPHCEASGVVLGPFEQSVAAGSSPPAPFVAVGGGDGDDDEEEEDSVDSVIEWIDEMLSGCGVVGEGLGGREMKRGGRGRDAREVLEWLEELKFEV